MSTFTPGQRAVIAAQIAAAANIRDDLQALLDADVAPPPPPTYTLEASSREVPEGGSVTVTLRTTGVATGTAVGYSITGIASCCGSTFHHLARACVQDGGARVYRLGGRGHGHGHGFHRVGRLGCCLDSPLLALAHVALHSVMYKRPR